jgi:hypothetical protein
MSDKTNAADQSGESTSAVASPPVENASSAESSKSTKKPSGTFTLHPLQDKAIRYLSFMLSDTSKPQTAAQIVQEAIARHLTTMQKQGNEYPPKMLAELTRLGLIK